MCGKDRAEALLQDATLQYTLYTKRSSVLIKIYEIAILYKCLHVKPIYVLLVETLVQQTFLPGFVEGQKR